MAVFPTSPKPRQTHPAAATTVEPDPEGAGFFSPAPASQAVSAFDDTHVNHPPAEAPLPTQRSASLPPSAVAIAPTPQRQTAVRATVLPRVERVGDAPRLVHQEKHRYERAQVLGEGGVGLVLKAMDNDIGRPVAVKRLRAGMQSPDILARFVEEIRLIGKLEHPNIVPIHDVGVDEAGEYYFVMKFVEGETLESIIRKLAEGDREYHRRYPVQRRVEIFLGILDAIAYAHGRGILHRDIKPANVMVGPFGEVLVMDWGIAKRIARGGAEPDVDLAAHVPSTEMREEKAYETQIGALVGTPLYMSPEQAMGKPLDERSDIYSLCVLLHELLGLKHYLADKPTVPAVLAGVMSDNPPLVSFQSNQHQSSVPAELTWFLSDGLHKDPARRFSSVELMIAQLNLIGEGKIPVRCHLTFTKRATREWLRFIDAHPFLMTGAMALGVLGVIALVVLLAVHH